MFDRISLAGPLVTMYRRLALPHRKRPSLLLSYLTLQVFRSTQGLRWFGAYMVCVERERRETKQKKPLRSETRHYAENKPHRTFKIELDLCRISFRSTHATRPTANTDYPFIILCCWLPAYMLYYSILTVLNFEQAPTAYQPTFATHPSSTPSKVA